MCPPWKHVWPIGWTVVHCGGGCVGVRSLVSDANVFHAPWTARQDLAFRHTVNVVDRWTGSAGTLYVLIPALMYVALRRCCGLGRIVCARTVRTRWAASRWALTSRCQPTHPVHACACRVASRSPVFITLLILAAVAPLWWARSVPRTPQHTWRWVALHSLWHVTGTVGIMTAVLTV